jgi:hypothetical protein
VIQDGGGAPVDAASSTFQDIVHAALYSALRISLLDMRSRFLMSK